jgi:hypothetical protein
MVSPLHFSGKPLPNSTDNKQGCCEKVRWQVVQSLAGTESVLLHDSFVFFFFLFVSTRVWTHGLELVKQALPLEPFCFAVFQIGSYAFGPGSS